MLLRVALAFVLALPVAVVAQDQPPAPLPKKDSYKLEYVVTELDNGKKVDSHSYTLLLGHDLDRKERYGEPASGRIRIGSRVPMLTAPFQPGAGGAGVNPVVSVQYNYQDVGMNIDARAMPVGDTLLSVSSTFSFSTIVVASEQERAKNPTLPAVTRQVTAEDRSTVTFGKQVTIFNMDEPNSKRSFQIQLTATRVTP